MRDRRPAAGDHHEYYSPYVALVPDGDIVETLAKQGEENRLLLESVPAERETYRYAPGKWSLREVVGHLMDTEWVFGFRSLWIARGADAGQPAMDQDAWAGTSNAGERDLAELAADWTALRANTVRLFRSYDDAAWARVGTASGYEVRVGALPWLIAGHELHHRSLLLRDYLEGLK